MSHLADDNAHSCPMEIRAQLEEFRAIKRMVEKTNDGSFATYINLESIKIHEQELVDELRAAELAFGVHNKATDV